MPPFILHAACAALLALSFSTSHAARVIGIADGDTLTVLDGGAPLKIRLAGIDSPERAQAYGQVAKDSLSALCFGKDASWQVQDIDRYGRTVARVHCAGVDVNRAQVERGMAWVYTRYNRDASLPPMQQQARQARRGLWADAAPTEPWTFRRAR